MSHLCELFKHTIFLRNSGANCWSSGKLADAVALPKFLGPRSRCINSIPMVVGSFLRIHKLLAEHLFVEPVESGYTSVRATYIRPGRLMLISWGRADYL